MKKNKDKLNEQTFRVQYFKKLSLKLGRRNSTVLKFEHEDEVKKAYKEYLKSE